MENQMNKTKSLLFSILPNILFFGIFSVIMIWNPTFQINRSGIGETFLLFLPIFMLLYAFVVYKYTRKILLPTVIFSVVTFLFFLITDYFTGAFSQMNYSTDVITGILLIFLIFTIALSLILLLTFYILKFIFKKLNK